MYQELNDFLSAETNENAWYDDGCIIAGEILSEFEDNDWNILGVESQAKPLDWQRKLAYCLGNQGNVTELQILLSLINIDDKELFEICVDSLRSFDSPEYKEKILTNPEIVSRVGDLIPKSGIAVRGVLQDFLTKISS